MPQRPTSVLVLSIIGIVLGMLYLTCCTCSALGMVASVISPEVAASSPQTAPLADAPGAAIVMLLNEVLATILGLMLVICAIGALSMKEWARKGMLAWAAMNIVSTALVLLLRMVIMGGPLVDEAMATAPQPMPRSTMMAAMVVVITFLGVVLTIYPCCVLFFFTRPAIKQAFTGAGYPPTYPPGGGHGGFGPPNSGYSGYSAYPPADQGPYQGYPGYQQPPVQQPPPYPPYPPYPPPDQPPYGGYPPPGNDQRPR